MASKTTSTRVKIGKPRTVRPEAPSKLSAHTFKGEDSRSRGYTFISHSKFSPLSNGGQGKSKSKKGAKK
jgi:hypothetical protein